MNNVVSPFDSADAWDEVQIIVRREGKSATYAWTGLPVDFDGDVVNEWDVKKAKGADGAKATDNGYTPTQLSMRWLLHRPEHFRVYAAFVADVKPRPGKEPKPTLVIAHPQLQLYNLAAFNLEKLHLIDAKAVDQWEARIDLVEWFPAPKPVKPGKQNGSVPETAHMRPQHLYDPNFFRAREKNENPALPSADVRPE